jgi:RNA polymerase sigma factor (sigma-70 family)
VATTTSSPDALPDDGRFHSGAAVRLGELFEECAPLVLGLCRSLLRNGHDAEDAAQQTFLSAYRSLLSGNQPRDPAAWLATIARHECGARARVRMREPLHVDSDEVSAGNDPFDATVKSADIESLRRALARLPTQQRRAFLLREFSGLSYGELAAALGVSEPAVESLLFRARRQLRLSLQGALASVNGVLWLPVRLGDLLSSASETPVAAKLASATGVVLVSTSAIALVPHHHARHGARPVTGLAAGRSPSVRRGPVVVPPASSGAPGEPTSVRFEERGHGSSSPAVREGRGSGDRAEKPGDSGPARQGGRDRSVDGDKASSAGLVTQGEIESASDLDATPSGDGSQSDSISGPDSGPDSALGSSDSGSGSVSSVSSDSGHASDSGSQSGSGD